MENIRIEQVELSKNLHKEVMVDASGWCGWNCQDIADNHDLKEAAFLAFEKDSDILMGFGVYRPKAISDIELILGAWSVSPNAESEFHTGSILTKHIEAKHGISEQSVVFYVEDGPLSAVVAQLIEPSMEVEK